MSDQLRSLSISELVSRALQGNRVCLARLMTLIEDEPEASRKIFSLINHLTGKAHVIGLTGSTGVGKSSLINGLIAELRRRKKSIGVVAVDPTSPFSGGAFLGDRVRMQTASLNHDVFVRSLGSRGGPGGISRAVADIVRLFDACGKDIILVETAGAGQSDIEVSKIVDTVILVTTPEEGDDIQVAKAGIMEIGDIFVVNKADCGDADSRVYEIQIMSRSSLSKRDNLWEPMVLKTNARENSGLRDLCDVIERNYRFLKETNLLFEKRKARKKMELLDTFKEIAVEYTMNKMREKMSFDLLVEKVIKNEMDVYSAVQKLLSVLQGS